MFTGFTLHCVWKSEETNTYELKRQPSLQRGYGTAPRLSLSCSRGIKLQGKFLEFSHLLISRMLQTEGFLDWCTLNKGFLCCWCINPTSLLSLKAVSSYSTFFWARTNGKGASDKTSISLHSEWVIKSAMATIPLHPVSLEMCPSVFMTL